jgi:hypothetical protein
VYDATSYNSSGNTLIATMKLVSFNAKLSFKGVNFITKRFLMASDWQSVGYAVT